jgi:acyl-CoA thioesterase
MSDAAPEFPLREMLGFPIEQGEGESWATIDIDERHINPHGTVHGAVMFMMLDTVMGGATMTVVGEGNRCSTIDIHIRYFAPCFGGALRAHAVVRRAGRRIVHLDGVVAGDDGTEYCAAAGVFAVIPAVP